MNPPNRPPERQSIFEQLPVLGAVLGFGFGLGMGLEVWGVGWVLATALGVVGYVSGGYLFNLPGSWTWKYFVREIESMPTDKLRGTLRLREWNIVQPLALLFLTQRGVVVSEERRLVVAALVAKDPMQRRRGWEAVLFAFPELGDALARVSTL